MQTSTNTGAQNLVGKFLVFFEQGCPRNPMYWEEAAYEATGLVGTKKLTIRPVALPLGHEVKVRTQCAPGDHIAAWFDTKDSAVQALSVVREAKKLAGVVVSNATKDLNQLRSDQGNNPVEEDEAPLSVPVPTVNGGAQPPTARVRTRSRAISR